MSDVNIPKHEGLQDHSFFAVIRHAQRADHFGDQYGNHIVKPDPPLTPIGVEQSKFAGQYLAEFFAKNDMKFDKIIIETSPYMRCIQTAAWIATKLNVDEVEVNLCAQEHMSERDFPDGDPHPFVQSLNRTDFDDKAWKEFNILPENVKIVNNNKNSSLQDVTYPESLENVRARAIDFKSEFTRVMNDDAVVKEGKKVCYLVISHGMMVWQMGELAEQIEKAANEEFYLPTPLK